MNIQQIKYIVALDRLRNFARADEACDVSQPTLSAMVQKLKEELDVYGNPKVYHLVIEKCTTFQLLCKGKFN